MTKQELLACTRVGIHAGPPFVPRWTVGRRTFFWGIRTCFAHGANVPGKQSLLAKMGYSAYAAFKALPVAWGPVDSAFTPALPATFTTLALLLVSTPL